MALQIVHAGEPHLSESRFYRLDRGRLDDDVFRHGAPRSGVDVEVSPDGITRRIAVDTFINKELPPRYRSFTLVTNYVFGERKFRVLSESVEPEWSEGASDELAYWGLVRQPTFASDLAKLSERQKKAEAWVLDPIELVKKRFPDARDVRLGVKQAGVAVVDFERADCPAHVVVFQPLRPSEGDKSLWDFAVIRTAEEPAYECLGEAPHDRGKAASSAFAVLRLARKLTQQDRRVHRGADQDGIPSARKAPARNGRPTAVAPPATIAAMAPRGGHAPARAEEGRRVGRMRPAAKIE